MQAIKRAGARTDTIVNEDTRIATVHHFTEHDSTVKDEGFQFTTYLDFNGVTLAQLIVLASQTVIIRARSKMGFRTLDPDKTNNMTIKVKDFLVGSKARNPEKLADRAKKALQALGMTEDQIVETLENLKK